MRRVSRLVGSLLIAGVGCSGSPSAPSPVPAPIVSPLASFAGSYTLTIEINESCGNVPHALRTRVYDVLLEEKGWHYMPIRKAGESIFTASLWPPDRESRYRFVWNSSDCDVPETVGSAELFLCGEGLANLSDSTLSGVMEGSAGLKSGSVQNWCSASHRFSLVRTK
jgi:hypothetical protein